MTPLNLKSQGMSLAASANIELLILARNIAHRIGQEKGECSIEDVRAAWNHPAPFGNWAGSIFKDGSWTYLRHIASKHDKANGRMVAIWRYTDNPPAERRSTVTPPVFPLKDRPAQGAKQLSLIDCFKPHYE